MSTRPSTTLADLFTLRFRADPPSAVRASLRRTLSDKFDDGAAHGWQAWLRWLSVPKIRFCNNDDEVRRGQAQLRCSLRAGWRDGSERLCQETDESSTRYNKRHTSSGSGVNALHPRRQYGRHTRDESIRSIFPRSRSAKASLGQWACRGCPWPVIGG